MDILPTMMTGFGVLAALALVYFAFAGPAVGKAQARRLEGVRLRHSDSIVVATEARMRRIQAQRDTKLTDLVSSILPNPALLTKRIQMTGKSWTLGQYATVSMGLFVIISFGLWFKGLHILLALSVGAFIGLGLPHWFIGKLVKRRVNSFTSKFPDAIDLLVRGLRSGLPIGETLTIVGTEVPDPVGLEFRMASDKMKIGRTMEMALQDIADRLGTPEFQFFVITLAIQRETGGNLAETLSNLSDVLRKRAQMKLKIRAMSSESKASAYIVGSLPFFVFTMIWFINNDYMIKFFRDQRLMVTGGGGMIWMAIGAFIMAKMVSFEI